MLERVKRAFVRRVRNLVAAEMERHLSMYSDGERARVLSYLDTDSAAATLADRLKRTVSTWGDPRRLHIASSAILNNATLNANSGDITIGDNTIFGHNVSIITGTHPISELGSDRHQFPTSGRDITIGKGVWIATNAVVIGPCTIGDDAVIAAGSIVVGGDVPPGTVYAGVPARLLRRVHPVAGKAQLGQA